MTADELMAELKADPEWVAARAKEEEARQKRAAEWRRAENPLEYPGFSVITPHEKPKIGDIIEILTSKGLAYAQYTHQHPQFGGLIRVFDALYEKLPDNFSSLVKGHVRFSTFFPLQAAIKRPSTPGVAFVL